MTIAYLNGTYMPIEQAKISPMDRGFLFGDGIYEVIPSYFGKLVGGQLHANRMNRGLQEIGIEIDPQSANWTEIASALIERNQSKIDGDSIGVYMHVSRGEDSRRFHAYPEGVTPTVFAFAFKIPNSVEANKSKAAGLQVNTQEDLRWKRCHIKSTSLLGNVMHFQQSQSDGVNETVLYNSQKEITEASVSNVFLVKDGVIYTPPLDNQLLPGITRHILIESIRKDGKYSLEERSIQLEELFVADEVWLTSSSKEVAPVTKVDGIPVGSGEVGGVWEDAMNSYHSHKFNF